VGAQSTSESQKEYVKYWLSEEERIKNAKSVESIFEMARP
jgi:hypothetical protein